MVEKNLYCFLRLTIWTAAIMKDIEIIPSDPAVGKELRTITADNVGWLLGAGWMFYFGSLLLNLVYYLMHPSSPELWTWGAAEKLEEWTPRGEKETRKRSKREEENRQVELTKLLPQESGGGGGTQIDDKERTWTGA